MSKNPMTQQELNTSLREFDACLTEVCREISEVYGGNVKAKHIRNRFETHEYLSDLHSVLFRQYFHILKLKRQNFSFIQSFKNMGIKIGFVL